MKEIKLKLSDVTHKIIKERAANDFRSMQQYIELWLDYIATVDYQPAPTPTQCPAMADKIITRRR